MKTLSALLKELTTRQQPYVTVAALSAIAITIWNGDANAAMGDWVDLGGGQARLVASLDPSTGGISGVIEVQLEEGWKTYWRSPGSSGIPPEFVFTGSGYAIDQPSFPVPQALNAGGSAFFGYSGSVRFPFTGVETSGGDLSLDMLIGVCAEVCIPATAQLSIAGQALQQSDPKAETIIAIARSGLPSQLAPQAIKLENAGDGIRAELDQAETKSAAMRKVTLDMPDGWVSDPVKIEQDGDKAIATVRFPERIADTLSKTSRWHVTVLHLDMESGAVTGASEGVFAVSQD